MIYHFKYILGNRWHTGDFDLNVETIDPKTGKVVNRENIFRTWEKPEPVSSEDDEFIWDDDEIEREGYSAITFSSKIESSRNNEAALRYVLRLVFEKGKKWLETGE